MAKVTNAFTTFGATANREDLANTIYNISPTDTPMMTLAGRRDVSNRTFDWQQESLKSADGANAQVEGTVVSVETSVATTRKSNVTQTSIRSASVTGSQQASNPAGKSKGEMAHQMALASKHLKRDMETILCSNQVKVLGEDSTPTARKTEGFEHMLLSNVSSGTSYAAPADAVSAGTDGTLRSITRAMLDAVLLSCYTNGAEPTDMLVPPAIKQTISGFAGRSGTQVVNDANELIQSWDVYKSDFGNIKVRPSRWIRTRTALVIDPSAVKVAYFRNFQVEDLAKTGDADSKFIVAEYGLEANEASHGKIADIQA